MGMGGFNVRVMRTHHYDRCVERQDGNFNYICIYIYMQQYIRKHSPWVEPWCRCRCRCSCLSPLWPFFYFVNRRDGPFETYFAARVRNTVTVFDFDRYTHKRREMKTENRLRLKFTRHTHKVYWVYVRRCTTKRVEYTLSENFSCFIIIPVLSAVSAELLPIYVRCVKKNEGACVCDKMDR